MTGSKKSENDEDKLVECEIMSEKTLLRDQDQKLRNSHDNQDLKVPLESRVGTRQIRVTNIKKTNFTFKI